jgi:hypothetical protein
MSSHALLTFLTGAIAACSGPTPAATAAPSTFRPPLSQVPAPDTTVFLLDGHQIRRGDVSKIDRAHIAAVRHLVGPAAIAQYGPGARDVWELTTKSSVDSTVQPLFFLDGNEIPARLARVLDAQKIASIEVLKGPPARSYGQGSERGVVLVKSKTGSN